MNDSEIRLNGRAIVVTGGGRGLGREQAMLLGSRGAMVVVADNGAALTGSEAEGDVAEQIASSITSGGGKAVACRADLSTEAGATHVVEHCLEAFGRIDGIVHYASSLPRLTPPDELVSQDLDLVMRVNPIAASWMIRAAWPHMCAENFGRILLIPSAALYGALGNMAYATAKSAYLGMIRCIALEGQQHYICVNGIMPAARTRMTEGLQPPDFADWFNKTMFTEHVAAGGAYLLSDQCDVSGEIFAVGGGRIARVMIAESEGVTDACNSVESVAKAMPKVLSSEAYFYPRDLTARSMKVNSLLGFSGGLEASKRYAVDRDDLE